MPARTTISRNLLRRYEWLRHSAAEPSPSADRYAFRGRSIDFEQLELRTGDKRMPLTLMEAALLRYLVQHEGVPVSREAILEGVWGLHEDTDTRAIDNFIVRLRRYIEDDPTRPRHLQTVRGVGYRFVAKPE
jgi:DNA-binding response OmpR family regulator